MVCHPNFLKTISLVVLVNMVQEHDSLQEEICFLERQHTIQYGIRSVQYSGAKLWNSIPSEIRLSSTVKQFRTKLKKHYLKSYEID